MLLSEKLPRGLVPRGLTKAQAAAYVGCETEKAFEKWIETGKMPSSMAGTARWDRKALDMAMDRLSGITTVPAANDPVDAYSSWKAAHG